MEHKIIFAENLKKKMQENGKTRKDICDDLGISYFTVTDWVNAKKMPRMDKVEKLANYFGCLKSDLIEEKSETKNPTTEIDSGISKAKQELINKVMQMSDEELLKLDLLLRIVESK